jgi:ATP-dependent RNA helicase HelY
MTTPAAKYAAAKSRSKHQVTSDFIAQFDFAFDQFQIEACHAVESGHGVLVAAPTGAGKTVVGEFAAFLALRNGRNVFTPHRSKRYQIKNSKSLSLALGKRRLGY